MEKKKSTKTNTKKKVNEPAKKETKKVVKTAPKAEKKVVKPVEKEEVKKEDKKEVKTIEINVDTIKNVAIVTLIIIVIFGFSFLASGKSKSYSDQSSNTSNSSVDPTEAIQAESDAISEDEQAEIDTIDVDKYLEYLKGDEATVIYVARPTCHYCQIQEPIMRNIVYKYENARIYYLNTDNFEGDDQNKFIKSDDIFSEGFGTPMILVVKDGEVYDSIEGLTSGDELITFFQSNGIIA